MKGATAEPWAKIKRAAKSTKAKTIGIIHQSFLFHIKRINSPTIFSRARDSRYFRFFFSFIANPPTLKTHCPRSL